MAINGGKQSKYRRLLNTSLGLVLNTAGREGKKKKAWLDNQDMGVL